MLKIKNRYLRQGLDCSLENLVITREKPTYPYIWILRKKCSKDREKKEGRREGERRKWECTYIGCCAMSQSTLWGQWTHPPGNRCLGHPSIPSPGKMSWLRRSHYTLMAINSTPLPHKASNCLLRAVVALALPLGIGQKLNPSWKATSTSLLISYPRPGFLSLLFSWVCLPNKLNASNSLSQVLF